MSSGWNTDNSYVIRVKYWQQLCHQGEILTTVMSSGWNTDNSYVIRVKYWQQLCHQGEMLKIGQHRQSPGWYTAVFLSHPGEIRPGANSSGWLRFHMMLCHLDEIGQHRKPSRWHPAMPVSHPDEILSIAKSSRWLRDQHSYLIRMA